MTMESLRLKEAREGKTGWKKWGPYLSERQWGTVREDYSEGNHGEDVKEYYFYLDSTPTHCYIRRQCEVNAPVPIVRIVDDDASAHKGLSIFDNIPLRYIKPDFVKALKISKRTDIYAYDAYVLECAIKQRALLLTLDKK
jgi:hypothetical protein